MSSLERVDDGEWHTVVFNRVKRKGTLSVDGGDAVVALSEDGVSQLDTNGWMWIGKQVLYCGWYDVGTQYIVYGVIWYNTMWYL